MVFKRRTASNIVIYCLLVALLVIVLFPIYWMFVTSTKEPNELYAQFPRLWPKKITLQSYSKLLFETYFPINIRNSLFVSIVVVLFSTFMSLLAAYSLARMRFRFKKPISRSILYTYMMPRTIMFIPFYLLVSRLGLTNSLFGLILVYPTFTIPYATWMLTSYFKTIPIEIEEASMIDGCSRLTTMRKIFFPLASPGIISTMIFSFTLCWSEYLYALVFISDSTNKTITVGLADLIFEDIAEWGQLMGGAVIAAVPVILLYMLASSGVMSGLTEGGVKE
jgi:multiple sugar transport system permease protein